MNAVLALIEHEAGRVRRIGLEMATKAADLAKQLGIASGAIVLGKGAREAIEQLKMTPVDTFYLGSDVPADQFLGDPAVDAIEGLLKQTGPAALLVPATNAGKDTGARLAVRLGAGVITEATDIALEDGALVVQSPKFGGSEMRCCRRPLRTSALTPTHRVQARPFWF